MAYNCAPAAGIIQAQEYDPKDFTIHVMAPNSIKVLLVEDNPGDARLVRELLIDAGANEFLLEHTSTLHDALDHLINASFDVMLLDLSLPDAHGMDTIKQIMNVASTMPIVVLSGNNDTDMALEAVQFGAQDYLVKGQGDGNLLARALHYAIDRKHTEERLAYLAHYDTLTGLPNRILFNDRLAATLRHAERHKDLAVLMFLDVDHFKDINDTLGHSAGDTLLQDVAKRLRGCIREEDTIARLGGDEFTIILQGIHHRTDAANVAVKMLDSLEQPFVINDEEVFVTISIGIASYPNCGRDAETLIRNADTALYRAKSDGRNKYKFFETEMNAIVSARMKKTNDLRHAVQRDEFRLYYQPLIETTTGNVFGMEALLRWQHPDKGLLAADEFVPLLEETGLIIPVGEWVLQTACRQSYSWQQAGLPSIYMSVNLSARQFHKHDLVARVAATLQENRLDPHMLQLEITESVLMDDTSTVVHTLEQMRRLGVRLAIDDFGTGYSSLSYLKQYPFDTLKFDRSFVQDMTTSKEGASIVAAVINLGHSINMSVLAEGVESQQQLSMLQENNCDQYQGFLAAQPMSVRSCTQWLQGHPPTSRLSLA